MKCPSCQAINPSGHRFCGQCGTALAVATCPGCSEPVQPAQHLCGSCGWLLRGERRQVTVVFCDLVGSTELAAAIDPEDLRDLIKEFYGLCGEVVTSFGGHIGNYLGDGVLIIFGYPTAHEDAAARAVTAGLEILRVSQRLTSGTGEPVRLRVGIATGLVVVDGKGQIDDGIYGETTNLAARIQSVAAPDTVVIADATRRLIGHRFSLQDLGTTRLKGFAAPIRLWRPLQQRSGSTRFRAQAMDSALGPLWGRDRETATLMGCWEDTCRGRFQAIHLIGEAGIGKSRLVQFLLERVQSEGEARDTCVLQCSPLQTQSALFPVKEWLRRRAVEAIGAAPSPEALPRGLEQLVARELPQDNLALPLLSALLNVEATLPAALLGTTPESRRQQTQERLRTLLLSRGSIPRLIVIEDLHWSDPSTLELLEALAREPERQPVLVLTTMRPEQAPPAWRGPQSRRLSLERLDRDAALALAGDASAGASLPPALLQRIVEQTDGVPLFVEEMARSVVESWSPGAAASMAPSGFDPELPIPGSLNDSLLSRLDRMVQGKAVAQMASMLGRDLSHEMLAAIWPGSPDLLDSGIEQLVQGRILQPQEQGQGRTYSFRHALIRDAAYASILRSVRMEQHRAIGTILERDFPALAKEQPEILAQHFAAAQCGEQACRYRVAAAQAALQQNAHLETIGHVQSGLELLALMEDEHRRISAELELRVCAIPALLAAKGYGDAEVQGCCERALALCDQLPESPNLVVALFGLWTFHVVRANHRESLDLAHRFLQLARSADNDDLLLEADLINGIAHLFVGDHPTARRHLEAVVDRYDRERHAAHRYQFGQDPAAVALGYLGWIAWITGQPSRARALADEALQLSESLDHPFSHSFVLCLSAWQALFSGDHHRAARLTAADMALCSEQEILVFLAQGKVLSAVLQRDGGRDGDRTDGEDGAVGQGRGDGGAAPLEEALAFFMATGARCFLTHWEAALALARAGQGDWDGAHRSLDGAMARMETSRERWAEPELHRLRGEVRERQGADPEVVEADYHRALAVAAAQGAPGWGLQAALSLARSLGRRLREREAIDILQAALLPFPPEDSADRTLRDARRFLADLQRSLHDHTPTGRGVPALSGGPADLRRSSFPPLPSND